MSAAIELRGEHSARAFRELAVKAKDPNQARRLLALAAVREGKGREEAARIGGMDRQTLRDWVHAYNEKGVDGLINAKAPGRKPKLNPAQKGGGSPDRTPGTRSPGGRRGALALCRLEKADQGALRGRS